MSPEAQHFLEAFRKLPLEDQADVLDALWADLDCAPCPDAEAELAKKLVEPQIKFSQDQRPNRWG